MQKQQKNGNFVQKLEDLLQSQDFSDIICWDSSKTIIDVLDIKRMEEEIIPKYFRHQKFESFVRQLNLYGFKKIKIQGRHRFTHSLLVSGQQLSSIPSFKCLKNNKSSKETPQTTILVENGVQESQVNSPLLDLMENQRCNQPSNQQMNIIIPKESYQKLGANTVFIIPASYCNYWNFNQFMGGQNMSNLPILASFMPQ